MCHNNIISDEVESFERIGKVLKSRRFRNALATTAVGAVLSNTSDSSLLQAVGVAGMIYGGFKLVDTVMGRRDDD